MPYLENEIKNLNRNKRIKIRLNKIVSGFSIYLEFNRDYKREKKFLKLQIGESKILSKKDKESLYKAEIIRDKKELELFSKNENFVLQNKITHADFLEYFDSVAKKKKLPSYHGSFRQLKTFTREYLKTSYLKFNAIDVKFCSKYKEYLLELVEKNKLANPTAKTYMTVFSATLNKAVTDNIIHSNPATRIHIKPIDTKIEFLEEDELKRFYLVDTTYTDIKKCFFVRITNFFETGRY